MGNHAVAPRHKGVLAPVVTPFTPDLEIDLSSLAAHCRWLPDDVGLALFGTNSEAASIAADERMRSIDALLDVGLPASRMMPGTGACALTEAVTLTRHAVGAGAPGVLVLPPFFFKDASEDGLYGYYAEIIERVADERLAVYLYHIPQLTGVPITIALIERLLKAFPNAVAGAKDSSGDWNNSRRMIETFARHGFDVFPSSESLLTDGLAIGAAGCISATANVNPGGIDAVYHSAGTAAMPVLQAEADAIRRVFQATAMIPAMKATIAHFSGRASWAVVRPPLTAMGDEERSVLLGRLAALDFDMPRLPGAPDRAGLIAPHLGRGG